MAFAFPHSLAGCLSESMRPPDSKIPGFLTKWRRIDWVGASASGEPGATDAKSPGGWLPGLACWVGSIVQRVAIFIKKTQKKG
ncbi:hypothetical protein MUN81_13230 [Hymenobacter sp. 5317J-9]|uniref:hypothetical protein n=1 Tax=Hymenobacter sp. 5317J-9 TaxID=2932250 RepID=UPI001FD6570D|nr:hypothetical protein [Hymenobacter sp. 5317J-9]UOQ96215.1 hypothetical protein MUN81_13230 [Hymenobacter sp. 5317J-9]